MVIVVALSTTGENTRTLYDSISGKLVAAFATID